MSFSLEILLRFLLMIVRFQESDDASDQFCFQRDLDNLHHWNIRNAMVFNVKKCKVMRLTKRRQPLVSNYSLPILFWKNLKNSKTW